MASNDKDPPGGNTNGGDAPDKSSRPSRVIDLEAADVEVEDEPETAPDRTDAGAKGQGDTGKDTGKDAADASKTAPRAPRQRTKPTDIRGFVTHMAAGLAGGLIGVIGVGLVLDPAPPGATNGSAPGMSQEIQKIGQRLDALDTALGEQAKTQSGAVPEAVADAMRALNRIEARLGVIEARPEAATVDLDPLGARVSKLEAALQSAPATAAEEGGPGAAPAPELRVKIDDISRKLERRTASLGADIEALRSALDAGASARGEGADEKIGALETRLAAIENKPDAPAPGLQPLTGRLEKLEAALAALPAPGAPEGSADGAQSAALSGKIADVARDLARRTASLGAEIEALEGKLTGLAARPSSIAAQISLGGSGGAVTLALAILRRTIDRGESYEQQLKALEEAAPGGLDLTGLAAHAKSGIRTGAALLAALDPALRAAREAAARSDGDTFLTRLASNARSVVRVRRLGQSEGTSAQAVLSRMEAHLRAADLPGALTQAEGLSGPALQSLQPWLDMAKARQGVEANLADLERRLLAGLQAASGANKSR